MAEPRALVSGQVHVRVMGNGDHFPVLRHFMQGLQNGHWLEIPSGVRQF